MLYNQRETLFYTKGKVLTHQKRLAIRGEGVDLPSRYSPNPIETGSPSSLFFSPGMWGHCPQEMLISYRKYL